MSVAEGTSVYPVSSRTWVKEDGLDRLRIFDTFKRFFDVLGASALLCFLSPLMLVVALG